MNTQLVVIVLEMIVFYYFCLNVRYSFAESSTKYFPCALVSSLHHHQQEDTCSPSHMLLLTLLTPDALCVFLRDHHQFLLLCMRLLSIHLSLAHAGGTGAIVLGAQGRPLRNLLFRLIDTNMPDSIQQVN